MVRSLLTDADGRIVTDYNGEKPNNNHDWAELDDDQYIRPKPPEGHTAKRYLKSEADDDLDYDEETDVIGVVFEQIDTE